LKPSARHLSIASCAMACATSTVSIFLGGQSLREDAGLPVRVRSVSFPVDATNLHAVRHACAAKGTPRPRFWRTVADVGRCTNPMVAASRPDRSYCLLPADAVSFRICSTTASIL
jgi:hypothetical protein